jgi:hypothetical protein
LLNRTTGQYSTDLRAVLLHLFTTHGKITPQQVKAKEMSTYNMHYDISQPVDTVFNTIDDLTDLAEHARSPMTPQQMIDMAYVIFAHQPIFQQDLRLWNRRPLADRTWANMLDHFRDAQSDLSSLPNAGDIFHQQPPHQANAVATMADLVAKRLLDALPADEPPPVVPPPDDTANAAFQQRDSSLAAREAALLTQMTEMMSLIRTGLPVGRTNLNNQRHSRNSRAGRHGRSNDRGGARSSRGSTPTPRAYCWSPGVCAHSSAQCNNQLPGHQTSATFANMQGGNTPNCFWLPA